MRCGWGWSTRRGRGAAWGDRGCWRLLMNQRASAKDLGRGWSCRQEMGTETFRDGA
ncbi:hypothetical protein [Citrobacter freundii]|uniref:hypothetical protein n=1 Tax=Citrobacter freundii TaxID=546 RepID=UPI001BD072EA